MSRVVKKSAVFQGDEGLDLVNCQLLLADQVALRPGEEVESVEVVADKPTTKVEVVSNKGKSVYVFRVVGLPEQVDFPSMAEARKWMREALKSHPGVTAEVQKVALKEGGKPVVEGRSVLVRRRVTVEVTVVKA